METIYAMVLAMHRDLLEDSTMQEWRRVALGCTMHFKASLDTESDFHFAHIQCRENPGIEFDVVRHSALQRIIDIATFVTRAEASTGVKQTASGVSQAYTVKLKLADGSEKVTKSGLAFPASLPQFLISQC